jgi:O-glycosyl hydrolase
MLDRSTMAAGSLIAMSIFVPVVRAQTTGERALVMIRPSERYQFIQGFGVNYTGPYFRDDQKQMFDMLIKDLGATMFRVVPYLVYSNWEEVNDNDDPNVMNWEYYNDRYSTPIFEATWNGLRFLNSRGIRPVIGIMGPVPEWMLDDKWTPPKHKVCQTGSQQRPLKPAMYDEFAEMVVSMVMYARTKAGIDFDYFSPFNETDCYPPEGPRIDPEEAPKVLAAVARRLRKEGLGDIKLTPADQAVITNDYIGPILRDPELMKQVGAFTLHTYGENSVGPQVERVKNSKYADVPVWLTEYGDLNDLDKTGENDWKKFSLAANRRALTALNQGASAVFFFDAFDDYEECARRLTFYGLFRSADHIYSPRKRYYATRQLYHFVPPGAQRIGAAADVPGLTTSAFHDGSTGRVIVVGVKEGGPNRVRFAVEGAPRAIESWDLYMTTRSVDCVKADTLAVVGGAAEVDLPDEAVFTLVGREQQGLRP